MNSNSTSAVQDPRRFRVEDRGGVGIEGSNGLPGFLFLWRRKPSGAIQILILILTTSVFLNTADTFGNKKELLFTGSRVGRGHVQQICAVQQAN